MDGQVVKLARKLPGHSQLERVRAARCILHSAMGSETRALRAFMDIFHPEVSQDTVREMVLDMQSQGKR